MSYTNLFVSSNSDSEDSNEAPAKCEKSAEAIDKVGRLVKKPKGILTALPEGCLEEDDDVFEDVQSSASWNKNIDRQTIAYCGLDEPTDSLSEESSGAEDDVRADNDLGLKSSAKSDDENDGNEFHCNDSKTEAVGQNLPRVEISIVSGAEVGVDMQPEGMTVGGVASIETEAGAPFDLQSNGSGTGISVQTDISIATRSENSSVDNEQEAGSELRSNGSGTEVSLNNTISSAGSDENVSVLSDPEVAESVKSDDSRSIRTDDSFGADGRPDIGVDLLLEECRTGVATLGVLEERASLAAEAEFGVEECKGSISLIIKTNNGVGETTCEDSERDASLFKLDDGTDAPSTTDKDSVEATGTIAGKLAAASENESDFEAEADENSDVAAEEVIDDQHESETEAGVHLRTEEFKRSEAMSQKAASENAGKSVDTIVENVQVTWDFNTNAAIKAFFAEKTGGNIDGNADSEINDVETSGQDNDPPSDAGENDPEPVADMASTDNDTHEMQPLLKIVDSPTQLTTKSLDVLSSNSENPNIPEELHNSKSFGIPNKKSSKNRSACSLVKHNNSVEIIRTKSEDEDTDTEGGDDDDTDDGLGYGFANKSSSSLGKHRDSVELLCGKRFDAASSTHGQRSSFLVHDDQDETGAAYRSRSGLLKIRDSVEVIGMGADEDREIGDVSFESGSHHSPRSILKINNARSKENACSNSRLVSWKDKTVETELETNFPDEAKQGETGLGAESRVENLSADLNAGEDVDESAVTVVPKKKPAKKPPRPKVGNLIKLFSSSKKIAFEETDSEDSVSLTGDRCAVESVQNETLAEVSNEGDSEEIKKTFTFWKKVCEDSTGETKSDEQLNASENDENKSCSEVEKAETVIEAESENDPKSSVDNATVPKKPHKFVEKFEGTSVVPNPLFRKFPLPVDNVFVKDRVSVLERSNNGEQDGVVKSAEGKPMKN